MKLHYTALIYQSIFSVYSIALKCFHTKMTVTENHVGIASDIIHTLGLTMAFLFAVASSNMIQCVSPSDQQYQNAVGLNVDSWMCYKQIH